MNTKINLLLISLATALHANIHASDAPEAPSKFKASSRLSEEQRNTIIRLAVCPQLNNIRLTAMCKKDYLFNHHAQETTSFVALGEDKGFARIKTYFFKSGSVAEKIAAQVQQLEGAASEIELMVKGFPVNGCSRERALEMAGEVVRLEKQLRS